MANPTTTRVSSSTYMTSQTQTHTMLLCIVGRQRKNYFRKIVDCAGNVFRLLCISREGGERRGRRRSGEMTVSYCVTKQINSRTEDKKWKNSL